jgi:hypothetical protein
MNESNKYIFNRFSGSAASGKQERQIPPRRAFTAYRKYVQGRISAPCDLVCAVSALYITDLTICVDFAGIVERLTLLDETLTRSNQIIIEIMTLLPLMQTALDFV